MVHKQENFSDRALDFYRNLHPPADLPIGVEALNPHQNPKIMASASEFFNKFYSDNKARIPVFGINPGRLGSGLTGVAFTDPVSLWTKCGIQNDFPKKKEISSEFIYMFAEYWGGVSRLYSDFFFSAVSPIGYSMNDKNYNFYDSDALYEKSREFIIQYMRKQISMGLEYRVAIILGSGHNKKIFDSINDQHHMFNSTLSLPHPRFIMQYDRKNISAHLDNYRNTFSMAKDMCVK